MAESGKVRGERNLKLLADFIEKHDEADDWGKFVNRNKTKLKKDLISKECGFGNSAFVQNLGLRAKFNELELCLRQRGILVIESSQQTVFEQLEQDVFIQEFEANVLRFKSSADKLEKMLWKYSRELK